MSLQIKLIILIIIFAGFQSVHNVEKIAVGTKQYAVLDSTQAQQMVNQCSRFSPEIDGSWNPSVEQIKSLEINILSLHKLTAKKCCIIGEKVDDVTKFYRQYVGIIVKEKKLVYINAFHKSDLKDWSNDIAKRSKWKREAYMVCDGGNDYWGATYDPKANKFNNLSFNGPG